MDEVQNIRSGFTLLELIMAIMILAIMMILSFFCFDAVVQSWNAGMEMSDAMSQADYVMNQVESGLRSAYYSSSVQKDDERGFQFSDGGEGPDARDSIAWMKEGRAFVGGLVPAREESTYVEECLCCVALSLRSTGHDPTLGRINRIDTHLKRML